jgi:ferritin-like metal-binding protein YciE
MKLFSAKIDDLRTLYIDYLQKALDMEQEVVKALPTMVEKSTDPELATAFSDHLEQSRGHADKVESILRRITGDAKATDCKVISSLVTETEDNIKDAKDNTSIRDITLIASAQQVEHHEMAVYGTLRTWAGILGQGNDVTVLESILRDEEAADELLTQIAGSANLRAAA